MFWAHYRACVDDPGYLQPDYLKNNNESTIGKRHICKLCGARKTTHVHHCRKCGKCVYQMDHHCFWTDNCVAYGTVKSFVLFGFYLFLICCHGIPTIIDSYYTKNKPGLGSALCFTDLAWILLDLKGTLTLTNTQGLIDLYLFWGSSMFAMLDIVIMFFLFSNIKVNSNMIDRLKKIRPREPRSWC
mmetsp:Transcript_29520/g.21337  ORF Transcript_29520/g.21337 Transcript_29520/m.21337 type:complete len:186 (-) Transcript_29520:175-732(-)